MSQDTHPHRPQRPMRTLPSHPAASSRMQATVPNQAIKIPPPVQPVIRAAEPSQHPTVPVNTYPQQGQIPSQMRHPLPQKRQRGDNRWLIGAGLAIMGMVGFVVMLMIAGLLVVYGNGVLPGVSAGGVDLGGLSQAEAASRLTAQWNMISVRDGERSWRINPAELGITIDAAGTAADAYAQGRGDGSVLGAVLGSAPVMPRMTINTTQLEAGLYGLAEQVNVPAVDAGIQLVNGVAQATAPRPGRSLNITAMMALITDSRAKALADGTLELQMTPVQPTLTDATPILTEAQSLLSNTLVIRAYDPVSGAIDEWSQSPQTWAGWLTASSSGGRLQLSADPTQIRAYLSQRAGQSLTGTQYLDLDEATAQVLASIEAKDTRPTVRIYHQDSQHVVQSGESIISIAWDYGVPYPWVQQANPGVDVLSVGQTLTIPSPDNFMPYDVVPDKRIVVSISGQNVKVYENGNLKWDWPASTGIADSPTWPGVYQVISHVPNAYAANWDLHMPNFMGVYAPVPGTDFTNGFHGFPTRGGGQLLWENSLGRRVTYGCILLSNTNVQRLYDWAEQGVVVEIQR